MFVGCLIMLCIVGTLIYDICLALMSVYPIISVISFYSKIIFNDGLSYRCKIILCGIISPIYE